MIRGSLPALVTPFKNGELDLVTLKKLVDWHIAEGSHGLVPVGTTGESPTLSHAEHQKVIREYPEKSTSPKNEVPAKEGASVPQSGQTPDPPNKESKQPQALNPGATQERVGQSASTPVLAVNKGWTNALGQRFVAAAA